MSFEMFSGSTVEVEIPTFPPTTQVSQPEPSTTLTVPLAGPKGDKGDQGEPGVAGDARVLSFDYTQVEPSTVWLITHNLGFNPVGIVVIDHVGDRHYPNTITWDDLNTVTLGFDYDIRGTAHLS